MASYATELELELEHVVRPTQKHFPIETLATFLNEAMALNFKSSRFTAEGVVTTRDNRDHVVFMKNTQTDVSRATIAGDARASFADRAFVPCDIC